MFLLAVILDSNAQELPPINVFTPETYKGESQNWSISQSKEGYIYVANNKGLLEFNGAQWSLHSTPNETIMRSVKVINDKIYTGFYMDFGFWKRDEFGVLNYTSLTKKYNIPILNDEQFWNIILVDEWILFQSLERIYLYNSKTNNYKIIEAETNIDSISNVNGIIYFSQAGKGLFKIVQGEAQLFLKHPIINTSSVKSILKNKEGFLIITASRGIFKLVNNQLKPLNIDVLEGKTVFSVRQLSNGNFLIGTISHGMFIFSSEGGLKYEINQKKGLTNNTVLSVLEDKDQNIWLGLDNGINIVNIASPFKIYRDIDGSLGTVYESVVFEDHLYLATNQGLFYRKLNSKDKFMLIDKTQGQAWCLFVVDTVLFCGHNKGTFIVNKNRIAKISDVQGTWDIKRLNDTLLLQGNYNGLHILKKDHNKWRYGHKIEGFNHSSRYFELYKDNQLFVNHEYKGVFKMLIDENLENVTKVEQDTSIEKGLHSSIVKYDGDIIYAYKEGGYRYSKKEDAFLKDSILSNLFTKDGYTSGKLILDDFNNLWSFSEHSINYLSPGKLSAESTLHRIHVSNSLRKGLAGFENIHPLNNYKYLLGIADGYIIMDLSKLSGFGEFNVSINSVTNHTKEKNEYLSLKDDSRIIDFKDNDLTIAYSVPYYGKDLTVNYQYKLKGEQEEWSQWSENSSISFKNLWAGNYIFQVRAKVGGVLTSNMASYYFIIAKPWYLSDEMIWLYVIIGLLFLLLMHTLYRMYYNKQKEKLLVKQQREFELKTLAKEKELILIRNAQLKADVDSKNKELATSTMSIIKKNEFLNTIKKELKSSDDSSVKKVIKIIDRNLNNTDDWKMFKEAFNNADKDFIDKIKHLHPLLTPNDLRLCAYLRLNLSSKEIAPLLNISPRSVEVKRYRLRKKMNLKHDENLTNYILEV